MYATNTLPIRDTSRSITGCCPPFDPAEWDGQQFQFEDKLFMKITTRSFMHIPLNMDSEMAKAMKKIEEAGATSDNEYFMLSDEVSPWHAEHYIAVSRNVPDAEMTRLSGKYLAKVFEGPYKDMPSWHKQLLEFVEEKGLKPLKTYFCYTMCPSCAKAYGHNYVIGIEQIE